MTQDRFVASRRSSHHTSSQRTPIVPAPFVPAMLVLFSCSAGSSTDSAWILLSFGGFCHPPAGQWPPAMSPTGAQQAAALGCVARPPDLPKLPRTCAYAKTTASACSRHMVRWLNRHAWAIAHAFERYCCCKQTAGADIYMHSTCSTS